jgi:O-antigen ligase
MAGLRSPLERAHSGAILGGAVFLLFGLAPGRHAERRRALALAGVVAAAALGGYFSACVLAPGASRASWGGIDNSVATFMEGLLFPSVALALAGGRRWWRLAGGGLALLMACSLALTTSGGAWLAVVLGAVIWLMLCWPAARWPGALLLTVVAAGLACGLAGAGDVPVLGPLGAALIRADRLLVYRSRAYLLRDFVYTGLGLGGTFALVFSHYGLLIQPLFITYAHQLYLQVWLAQGLPGIIAFLWLLIALLADAPRLSRRPADLLAQSVWIGLLVAALHGLTDARQYQDAWSWLPFFLLLGLHEALPPAAPAEDSAARAWRRRPWLAPAVAVLATGGLALALAGHPLAAWQANLGAVAQARAELGTLSTEEAAAELAAAEAHYRHALALSADQHTARQRLGLLLVAQDRFAEAVSELEAAHRLAPHNRTDWNALGLAYVWAGRLDAAEPLLRQVPEMADELNTWAGWRRGRGQLEQALWGYRMSLRLAPEQPVLAEVIAQLETELAAP